MKLKNRELSVFHRPPDVSKVGKPQSVYPEQLEGQINVETAALGCPLERSSTSSLPPQFSNLPPGRISAILWPGLTFQPRRCRRKYSGRPLLCSAYWPTSRSRSGGPAPPPSQSSSPPGGSPTAAIGSNSAGQTGLIHGSACKRHGGICCAHDRRNCPAAPGARRMSS